MALTKNQKDQILKLQEKQNILKSRIRALNDIDFQLTPEARVGNQAQIKKLSVELEDIPQAIENVKKQEIYKKEGKDSTGETILAPNAPYISADVLADLRATVPNFNPSEASTWFPSGIGSSALVYTGQVKTKIETYPQATMTKDDVKAVSALSASIWEDTALQNKIIGAYAAKGQNISKLQAGAIWGELVTKAGQIYAGGRGPKVTPMDLLTDQLSVIKGDEAALPQRSIQKIDPIVIKDFVSGIYEKTLGRVATEDEKNQWYTQIKPSIDAGIVTETKKIKNKKTGKMENVVITDPTKGFNQQAAGISIQEKLKEANPDDYDRQTRMNFSTWLSQNVAGA
jgi:hypothetical protein